MRAAHGSECDCESLECVSVVWLAWVVVFGVSFIRAYHRGARDSSPQPLTAAAVRVHLATLFPFAAVLAAAPGVAAPVGVP